MKESTEKFIEDVAKGDKCKDWKIVSVYDREDKEGIYAVMIDTGNGKSIIAFRGSESVSGEQWFKDWGQADFQIANGKMTSQEKAACKYLDKIANDKNYDKYQDIAVTGHSLGGNLAHVSTIYTASDACTTDMQNRIKQSVSMDGPGHPKEFIEKYSKAITKMQDKMTHYQWSAVGAIFSSLCTGDNYVKVDSSKFHLDAMEYAKYLDDLKKRGVSKTKLNFLATMGLVKELPSFINRHSTASLDPDENGNLKRASGYDIVSKIINKVTNAIDSDDPMQEYVGAMANIISDTAVNIIENGKDLIEMTPHMIECVKDYTKSWGSLIMCINNMSNNKHIPDSEEVALYLGLSAINFSKMVNSAVELNLNGISVFRDITKTISTYTLELHKLINKRANLNIDYRIFKFVYNNLMELKYTPITKLLNIFYGRDEEFNKLLLKILNLFNDAGAYTYPCDPLIFDLNGDGVKTVSLVDGVHFDFDKNGFAEKIGWVSAEDGLLVRDLDKDGKISSGRELMGDLTELTENSVASNGFQALAYYDENSDGVINSSDAIYSELKLWQDKNQNGTVDYGELMTLSQAGIESINVTYDNINETDENGNSHSQKGSYTRTDGTTGEIEDVWFAKDAADTILSAENNEQYYIEETDEIRNLPDIQGKVLIFLMIKLY